MGDGSLCHLASHLRSRRESSPALLLPTPAILALDSRTRTTVNGFSFNRVFGSKGFGTGLETSTFVMPLRWKSPF